MDIKLNWLQTLNYSIFGSKSIEAPYFSTGSELYAAAALMTAELVYIKLTHSYYITPFCFDFVAPWRIVEFYWLSFFSSSAFLISHSSHSLFLMSVTLSCPVHPPPKPGHPPRTIPDCLRKWDQNTHIHIWSGFVLCVFELFCLSFSHCTCMRV